MKKSILALALLAAGAASAADYTGYNVPFASTQPTAVGAYADAITFNVLVDGTYTITVQGENFRRFAHSGRAGVTLTLENTVASVAIDGANLTNTPVQYQPISCAGTNLCYPNGPTSYYTTTVELSAGAHTLAVTGSSWASNRYAATAYTVNVQ